MSINFPTSPSNGDVHSGFVYDSTLGVWNVISALAVKKFAVTAGSGIYIFNGDGTTADNNPTLYLTRGETYEFDINASGHPFYIKTTNSTGTGNAYSDGVTNNGTQSGTIKFVVQMDAPDTLHYNCQYHSSMNAPIYILDRVHSIDDLSDVDTSTAAPTNGQALVWDNTAGKWEPGTISSGTSYANSDVDTHLNTGTASANEVLSWTGSDYDWVAQASGGGGASVSVSDSAPSSPSAGDLWWDSSQAMMFIYYADGSSNQWVKANPSGSGGADIAVQETAPSNPNSGDLWFDPATLKTYVYYNDGDSAQWVQSNPTGGGGSGGGSSVTVSDTAPSSPSSGDLWWHSTNLKLYVYYTDGSSNQWVQTNPSGTVSLGVDDLTDVDTTTAAPSTGDLLQWNGTNWVPALPESPNRNKIINGNFDVWQRGTSFSASGYGADRWRSFYTGGTTTAYTQQSFTLGQTDVPNNPRYYARLVVTSDSSADARASFNQKIEGVHTFAGQTVTVSFWAKADASKDLLVELLQYFGTGGSPSSFVIATPQKFAISSTWTKYTKTFSVPSITGKTLGTDNNDYLDLAFWIDAGSDYNSRTLSLGNQSGTFEFSQIQIEQGSKATDFEMKPLGETIQDCKRYYVHLLRVGGAGYATGSGQTARAMTTCTYPVAMRAIPTITTVLDSSGSVSSVQAGNVASASTLFGGTSSASGSIWYKATATLDAEL